MGQRKSKIEQAVAQDIFDYITTAYKNLKGQDACVFYCMMRDYITETYLTEKDGE